MHNGGVEGGRESASSDCNVIFLGEREQPLWKSTEAMPRSIG